MYVPKHNTKQAIEAQDTNKTRTELICTPSINMQRGDKTKFFYNKIGANHKTIETRQDNRQANNRNKKLGMCMAGSIMIRYMHNCAEREGRKCMYEGHKRTCVRDKIVNNISHFVSRRAKYESREQPFVYTEECKEANSNISAMMLFE